MKSFIFALALVSLLTYNSACENQLSDIKPTKLRCENIEEPAGIDNLSPLLSWQLTSDQRNQKQTAYQIIVSNNIKNINNNKGDFWDSGKIISDESLNISYKGKAIQSGITLYWKIRVWDNKDIASDWSKPASWSTGLLYPDDWKAKWIGEHEDFFPDSAITGPAPYFRKIFTLRNTVKSARLYVSGLGFYELYINGNKIGDQVLTPAQTNYDRRKLDKLLYYYDDQSSQRVLYNTFDVTGYLTDSNNTIGMILGNGWYNQRDRTVEGCLWYSTPRLILQLEITYNNGQKELIISDESWKVTTGPIVHNGIFTGEVYDARLESDGWNLYNYNDSDWGKALLVRKPDGRLVSQMAPADKIIRSFHPVSLTNKGIGTYSFDAGEMISGWIQLKITGNRGTRIKIRYIEELGDDYGQIDTYFLKGDGIEVYEPRFTWHAFRTIEISGTDNPISPEDITVKVVNTDVEKVGKFECSASLLNKIYENYIRTQLGNFHGSISSDCPHRERLGYTGDGQIIVESSILNFDMTNFYQKWFDDMEDARNKKTGYVPHTAPFGGGGGGPAWGSAYVIMPWTYYLYYNDVNILEHHYIGMKQWVQYLGTRTDSSGIIVREEPNGWCLGDWATPEKTLVPESLVNTCYYYYITDIMSKVASVLGKTKDKSFFDNLSVKIKNDFNNRFYNSETGNYWEGRQGSDVFPLALGLVPEENKSSVLKSIVANVRKNKGHLDTGIFGTPLLLDVLTQYGMEDLAFMILNQDDYPGYGYYINGKNATTLWEYWSGKGSHSHPMFGSVVKWFFKSLAGINPPDLSKGADHLIIKPVICDSLTYTKASYESVYGKITSEWERTGNDLSFLIEIPANTKATIFLPSNDVEKIKESGKNIREQNNISILQSENGSTVLGIGSGKYKFVVKTL